MADEAKPRITFEETRLELHMKIDEERAAQIRACIENNGELRIVVHDVDLPGKTFGEAWLYD